MEQSNFIQQRKLFIVRLLKNSGKPINWVVESTIAKKLFEEYPDPLFWENFEAPGFIENLDSLKIFRGNWGIEYINKQFNIWIFKQQIVPRTYELGGKVGQDYQIKKKNNLKDFINVCPPSKTFNGETVFSCPHKIS